MAIQFATKISIQRLNDKNDKHYHKNIIYEPTKLNDGPNEYSILWNQIIISWMKGIITDEISLRRQYDDTIIVYFSDYIIYEIDTLINKFNIGYKAISLYYDTFRLKYYKGLIQSLEKLKNIILLTCLIIQNE